MADNLFQSQCVNTWRPNNGILELSEHWSIFNAVSKIKKSIYNDFLRQTCKNFWYYYQAGFILFFIGCGHNTLAYNLNQYHAASLSIAVYTFCAGGVWHQLQMVDTNVNKVQICWIFKTSTYQHWHYSQSEKFSKVTQSRHVVLHEDVYGLRPRQMVAIFQTTFSNAFSWMKMY